MSLPDLRRALRGRVIVGRHPVTVEGLLEDWRRRDVLTSPGPETPAPLPQAPLPQADGHP